MNYRRILNLFLILIMCLSFITPLFMSVPVMAAEEEEEDNFTTMPNYRWENQSETDSAVREQLIGDNYEIYNMNNETTGTQEFEKSRELNSRDFYFESRLALDVGGNQTEYFRDQRGDSCDYEEGDDEDLSIQSELSSDISEGILTVVDNTADLYFYLQSTFSFTALPYTTIVIRFKADNDINKVQFRYAGGSGLYTQDGTYYINDSNVGKWIIWEHEVNTDYWYSHISLFGAIFRKDAVNDASTVHIDYIKIIGDLDYATHVEDEIEDTWDWEDSDEYWYNEESNVSDFNDGTTEDWEGNSSSTTTSNADGWLRVGRTSYGTYMDIENADISVDASIYKHVAVELYTTIQTITSVEFFDTDMNSLYIDEDDILINTKKLVYGEFDGNWSGTETKLIIRIQFIGSRNDHNAYLNMTYLYDTELGDLEGVSHQAGGAYMFVNPEGYLSLVSQSGGDMNVKIEGNNIDPQLFDHMTFRIKGSTVTNDIEFIRALDNSPVFREANIAMTTSFVDHSFEADSAWLSQTTSENDLEIFFDMQNAGERIIIDYILLTGHWSETDGFKFSLLNADDEEGMSFQFTRNTDSSQSYNISIDMYDSVGVALDYSYSFDYDIDVNGWLRLRVGWNLDKRTVKLLFEYDNGDDIIKIREITDLFGDYIGIVNLLLLKSGFPSLCMNNSIGALARSYVIINYIDADWSILEWREPVGTWTFRPGVTYTQNLDSDFTSISPYGFEVYHQNVSTKDKFYVLSVDRFDGLSFDFDINEENLDGNDEIRSTFAIYNVHRNGTLARLFLIDQRLQIGVGTSHMFIVYEGSDHIDDYFELSGTNIDEAKGSISIYCESRSKVIMQFQFERYLDDAKQDGEEYEGTMTTVPEGEEQFTKEMVIVFGYRVETDNSIADDDIASCRVGGFDLVRKDIIGDIVGAILGPVVGLIAWLFSPFILLFQMLTTGLGNALKDLFSNLEPLFGILGGVFGTIIGGLEEGLGVIIGGLSEAIGGFLETLGEGLEEAFEGLWVILFGVADLLGQFIIDVVDWLLPVVADAFNAIIGFFAGLIFWVWDALGLPDLLAILDFVITYFGGIITSLPQIIVDLSTAIFFLGSLGLVLWWVWCVLLPVVANDPATAAAEIIDRFFKPIFPWDIAGFRPYFPQGIFVTAMTYFLIIAPAGGMYAIW